MVSINCYEDNNNMRIQSRTLKLISKYMADKINKEEIVEILKESGVDRVHLTSTDMADIIWMHIGLLSQLNDKKHIEILFRIITKFVHPLILGDEEVSQEAIKKFNQWLKYDGLQLELSNGEVTISNTSKPEESPLKQILIIPPGWRILRDSDNPSLIKYDKVIHTFSTNQSKKYLYFEYLFNHYGQRVDYKTLYELVRNEAYPGKHKPWEVNKAIRNVIYKLIDEFENHNVPVRIKTSRGFVLSIS